MDKRELCNYVKTLYESNLSREEIKRALRRQGIDEISATKIIDQIDAAERKADNKSGKTILFAGIVLLLLGLVATVYSHTEAVSEVVHSIYQEAIIVGVATASYGLADWVKSLNKRK